ncbi:MAG: alpha/beta hydrolase [Syntrophothermus sp.]
MTSPIPLLQRAREHGNPVIQGNRATFIWEGEAAPYLISDLTEWEERPKSFKRLSPPARRHSSAQPVWSCSLTVPRDAYVEYAFMDPDMQDHFLDPLNPHSTSNGMGNRNNFFYMPETMPSPFSMRRADVPAGTITRHRVDTGLMQDDGEREVLLYAPPARGAVPLLVVYDGPDYLHLGRLTTIVENMIADKRIRPIAIAFLQNARSRRNLEYLCSDATLSWLDQEVLPLARRRLRLLNIKEHPGSYGVLGASAGGIMAMYTGLRMPEIFGKVLSQSGVFALEGRDTAAVDLVRHGHAHDLNIWMDVGTLDDLLEDNRRMSRLLHEKEYNNTYREFSGGHNYTSWRDDVWRGLEALFPQ